ncbi:putative cohesin complex subunit [Phaeomoniella chlamydospora]|uniref:Structural maintenance of chromosomes protein n=1 Tax=Phaeomoniella chlamydospora TaxID=158046 RepID=A0A0G2FQQ2_PHACM|nr:putative cohesin complex subunit [Phaeomoniella chlamydospora]
MGKLVRLELYNFKSYKGHHILLFGDAYFTSIIGPNGSGKSNSMDAISFVLGIKSSHLRSTHLRDLVYRGRVLKISKINEDGSATVDGAEDEADGATQESTQNGATERHDPKSAWVMAVYEDDAGDEQQWKRTITSQGVSEYRINNRPVTAHQYNEALESENILIKARNFLVFQGDVEAIASQSPKDLTKLIEQISGSLEYKAEYDRLKLEAEEAAEQQTFQLNRRRGLNSEIKQYQEQKREADKYARKADERDQAVISHVLWKLYRFQETIDEATAEIQRHQEELKEHRRSIEKYEQTLDHTKKEHARTVKDANRVERAIKQKESSIYEKTNSLVPVDEKIEVTTQKVKKSTARIAEITKEKDTQAAAVKQLQKDAKTVEKAQAQWEVEWQKTASKQGATLNGADIQQYNKLKEEVNKRASADQIRVDNLKRLQTAKEGTVESLKSRLDEYEYQLKAKELESRNIEHLKADRTAELKQTSRSLEEKKKEVNTLSSERTRVAQLRTELDEKLAEVANKLLEADGGRKQNEKEIRMKETISTLKRMFPGVKGRVHELCKPKQKKFEDAVGIILGRHFDAVVVDTEKTAKDCIQHLREQRAGQATFIPLDSIKVQQPNSNLRGMHKGMRPAIDTVSYDEPMAKAIMYACGNSIVCDDFDIAKELVYQRGVDAKAVSIDGFVVHKGGLLTGGRTNDKNRRKWDDTEVENLIRLKDKLLADFASLPKAHRQAPEEERAKAELDVLADKSKRDKEEVDALSKNLQSKKKEVEFARQQLQEIKPKYAKEQGELNSLNEEIQEFQDAVSGIEDEIFSDFCQRVGIDDIRQYESSQGQLQQQAAQKRLEFTTQKSRIDNQLSFETQRLDATQNRITSLQNQISKDKAYIDELSDQRNAIQEELDVLNAELEQLGEDLDERKEHVAAAAQLVAEARKQLQQNSKHVEETMKEIAEYEGDVQRTGLNRYNLLKRCKLEDINIPLRSDSAKLDKLPIDEVPQGDEDAMDIDEDPSSSAVRAIKVEDYGIKPDFGALDDELKEDEDEEVIEQKLQDAIKSLTAELDKMAPNMRAVDRLDSTEQKLRSAEKEYDHSRKTYRDLREDFEDVQRKRSELFNRAFGHISENIAPIYRDLTKSANYPLGGQAYLDIEDSDEPYLDGIKYHAMPPLKRFRDMEHLSGGEKTMAALALLFAIHSFQPSPFFVLDEVDAALDNANVAKIAKYIREHAGPGLQFLTISLKPVFFQQSEALVGIYRDQVANSSKALTLDLRRYQ